ncbi:MAG TPA: type II secretion system F family protein [Bryobacteraceae bacterium]|jgi:tight adherence protein C|nr:type II secretion system F family protein [Bryobacteraceae bacterium]
MLIAISLFLAIALVVLVFGYRYYVRPSRMLDQLARTTSETIPRSLESTKPKQDFSFARLLEPVGNLLPVSPQDASVAKRELANAGFRSSSAVPIYYAIKIILAIVFVICALLLRDRVGDNSMLRLILPVAAGGIGFFAPAKGVSHFVKRRHEQIRLSLPDVLDLLVICSEAGCGLDQAMVNVSRELESVHPAVCIELAQVNMEIMAGKSRAESLRNFGRRTGEEEIKKLVSILVQTDRFGTSVSEALRTQSEFMRVRRRQIAEEKAGKVGVKLVFPIFCFSLPALMIVTAGPGLIQIFTKLLPAMRGFSQ